MHTFLVLETVGLAHGVHRKLHILIGGQRAEKFENHWARVTFRLLISICWVRVASSTWSVLWLRNTNRKRLQKQVQKTTWKFADHLI